MMPLAVMLGVPTGVFGAFLSVLLWRLDNNVYVQIGIIMRDRASRKERRADRGVRSPADGHHGATDRRRGGRRGALALPADS